jgi:HK97 family phage major capsid protein
VETKEILEQIGKAVSELRAVVDATKTETGETKQYLEKVNDRIDQLEAQLKGRRAGFDNGAGAEEDAKAKAHKAAFVTFLRKGASANTPEERKMLSGAVDGEGGYTVPDDFRSEVIRKMGELTIIRNLSRVINTTRDTVIIPTVESEGTAAWTAQSKTGTAAAYSEQDVTFGQRTLTPFKITRITKVSEELLEDSAVDIVGLLSDIFGRAFSEIEDSGFLIGTGTTMPTGILADTAVTAIETETGLTFAPDDLINLLYGVKQGYRKRGTLLMASLTERSVRKFKDQNDQYLWQPGLALDKPNTILGRPVYNQDDMDTELTAGKELVLFGDFSNFWIADRWELSMQRLNEKYADEGLVGFLARKRTDGKVALGEAFKKLTVKAGA